MVRTLSTRTWTCVALVTGLIGLAAAAQAADDTARFYGTWGTSVAFNGQMVPMVSVHGPGENPHLG